MSFHPILIVIVLGMSAVRLATGEICSGEKNGNVVIQAENTNLTEGWNFGNSLDGYTGRGYITWCGENEYDFRGKGLLSYRICVTGGSYKVNLWSMRMKQSRMRDDEGNNVYVGVDGEWTKLFTSLGQKMNLWKLSTLFDTKHEQREPVIQLNAGCQNFQVAGRSEMLSMDRFVLVKLNSQLDMNARTVHCNRRTRRRCGVPLRGRPSNLDNPVYVIFSNPSNQPARLFRQVESGELIFVRDIPAGGTIDLDAFELDMFIATTFTGDCMRGNMLLPEGEYRHDGQGYASFSIA